LRKLELDAAAMAHHRKLTKSAPPGKLSVKKQIETVEAPVQAKVKQEAGANAQASAKALARGVDVAMVRVMAAAHAGEPPTARQEPD
jgi:hypothetical protein